MATSLTQAYLKHEIKSKLDIETGREAVPDDEPTDAGDGEKSKTPTRFITVAVITVALAMIVLNGLVMTVAGEGIVYVAAFVAIVVGIANIGTELILGKMDTFRMVHNKLRQDVNVFSGENVRLTKANEELNLQVFLLKESEQRFEALAKEQNSNVQDLVNLVKENGEIIKEKNRVIREDIVESLVNAAFTGEKSMDGEFSDREINMVCNYMRGLRTVTVNEELLRKAIQRNRSVLALIDLIRDLDQEGDQMGDKIFVVADDAEVPLRQ